MAKAAIPAQILAIVGLSATLAGVHSLFVPIALIRESTGFVIPGSNGSGSSQEGITATGGGGAANPPESDQAEGEPPSTQGNAESPDGDASDDLPSGDPSASGSDGQLAEPGEGKVGLDQAAELHDLAMNGQGVWFLDARRRVDFDAGRVMGALYMEHTHVSGGEGLDEILTLSPPEFGDLLVIYCTGGDCQASEDTAILLEQAGYGNIAIMSAGYDEWAAAGLPTEGP